MLEQIIRDRRQTPEEFSADAERFSAEHRLGATLSPRHVQRLASGRRADGMPLGPVRPATRRLLEEMLGIPLEKLLGPPRDSMAQDYSNSESELRSRLAASRSIDGSIVSAFQEQMNLSRVIDRRLGAPVLLAELRVRIEQIQQAMRYATSGAVRSQLAEVLVDASSLAGWLSLDLCAFDDAWNFYELARSAARECDSAALCAYATGAQSVVLLDIGEHAAGLELAGYARSAARDDAPRLLKAWLSGAYGEAGAANGLKAHSLSSFDDAARLVAAGESSDTPYLVFDEIHLARWRGNALARLGDRDGLEVLSRTLERLDPAFTRAEATMRTDLSEVLVLSGEHEEALTHLDRAASLALQIGSKRQSRRIERLTVTVRQTLI